MQITEIELTYKYKIKASDRVQVKSSTEVYDVLVANWDQSKMELVEQFKILLLDRMNKVLGICDISTGGTAGTVVDAKLIFTAALKANAQGIILCHNHPSGHVLPSSADEQLTQKLKNAGKLLDIAVLDHLIISNEGYYSFADEGKL
jgi:DNA repair protein RadC